MYNFLLLDVNTSVFIKHVLVINLCLQICYKMKYLKKNKTSV